MKVILIDEEGKELEYTNFILFARHQDDGKATRCAANFKDVSSKDLRSIATTIAEAMVEHILPLSIQKEQEEARRN